MLKFSLRSLLAHKLRLALTVAAVTLGVAFVSGTFVLSDSMGRAFDQLFGEQADANDVTVRAASAVDGHEHQPGSGRPLDASLADKVRSVDGVASVEPVVSGYAVVLSSDGEQIASGDGPTLGANIDPDDGRTVLQGRLPNGPGEAALDASTARKAGYQSGDEVRILLESGVRAFALSGIVEATDAEATTGGTFTWFDLPTAQDALGQPGTVDQLEVVAVDGVTAVELRDRVATALPPDVEAVTSQQMAGESSDAVRDSLSMFTAMLLAFAAVSLLVGSFVIWNTFSVLVAQRRREVALLRAVGASRGQVLSGLVAEAGIIGAFASLLGLGVGVGLAIGIRAGLEAGGMRLPSTGTVVAGRTIAIALVIGVVVTVAAAVAPAVGATRVAPVEALRSSGPVSAEASRRRRVAGMVLGGAGAGGLTGVALTKASVSTAGLVTLLAFAGLVVAGPQLAGGVARLADRGRRGGGWRLAARNIGRFPHRAAATALALTIGLAVVCAVAVTAASTKASVADAVTGGNRADLLVQADAMGARVSPAVADALRAREEVAAVLEMRSSSGQLGDRATSILGVDRTSLHELLDLGVASGSAQDLEPGTVLLSAGQAKRLDAKVGDPVAVTFPETGEQRFSVAGTFTRDSLVGSGVVVSLEDFARNVTSTLDDSVLVALNNDEAAAATAKESISSSLAQYPNVIVQDPAEFTADRQQHVDEMLGMVTALLLLSIVVAVLGIINTLVLSVVERTREVGLLRAVGASRRQIRGVIRRESVLMSLLGATAGITLGTAAGVALSRALGGQGVTAVDVPVSTLVTYLLLAAVMGVLAAVGPARRASRVDVLKAIAIE